MKQLLISTALLTLAVSCSTNDLTEVAPAAQNLTIGFSTLNDRVTKAANDDATSSYMVYALSSADATAWYINEEVTSEDVTASGVTHYWPYEKTLSFYAYAPYGSKNITDSSKNGSFEVGYTVPTTADEDFTFSSLSNYEYSTKNGIADFTFSHMLAKASINVQLGGDLYTDGYTLTFTGATFNVVNNGVSIAGTTISEVAGTDSYAYTLSATASGKIVEGEQALLIAPHDGSGETACSIDLAGVVIYNPNNAVVYSSDKVTYSFAATQVFKSGTVYAVTITIDLTDEEVGSIQPIVFSASVDSAGWSNSSVTL